MDHENLKRWRLILGEAADSCLGAAGGMLEGDAAGMDATLAWLYGRDPELAERGIMARSQGGREASRLTTPEWINDVHRLFPQETIERLERDAIERFGIDDVVTNPEVLSRIKPNETLLRAVLHTKHLMKPEVLEMARRLVAEVVRQLMEKLARDVQLAFSGILDRRHHTRLKFARNLDFRRTIRDNLRRYDPQSRRMVVERLHFFARNQRSLQPWQVILLVDQSGSMVDSVIHSAVTAACLSGLPGIRTHLVAFDTSVVDLTDETRDPVELLMKVQLGGGTDIQQAVAYATELIEHPARSIVVLISDFYEGSSTVLLENRVRTLTAQKTLVLGLAALDSNAKPCYDHAMAARLVAAGAEVGAMTPGHLASWLAEKIRS